MTSILLWILNTILDAVSYWNRKKAMDNSNLSVTFFKYFAFIFWFAVIFLLVFLIWIDISIFVDFKYLSIILLITIFWVFNNYLQLNVIKKTKLSELMPYENIDKLFIIIIWFLIYYWSDKWVSVATLIISIFTIFIIILFSIDFKSIKIEKNIILFILYKINKSVIVLTFSFILLKYSSITLVTLNWILELIIFSWILIILKESFNTILKQSKTFYINRFIATILWRSAYILWLYIIQSAGVIIATLLWFFWIVFSIFSMKFILRDSPTKKQIILSFIVILLIWFWYYFK